MCNRGVFQLRNVKLQYCDFGGSSKGIRDLLNSQVLDEFLDKHPDLNFEAYIRTGSHPSFFTEYVNGWGCSIPLRNCNPEDVMKALINARNRFGQRSISHSGAKVISSNKSIQGGWKPNMWGNAQMFELEKLRELPDMPKIEMRKNKERKPKSFEESYREYLQTKHG